MKPKAKAQHPLLTVTAEPTVIPSRSKASAARSLQLALAAVQVAEENQGQDILLLDLCDLTCIFDYFVIATGTSRRQLHAISDDINSRLVKDLKDKRLGIEGYQGSSWILLDFGTVVIHLFEEAARDLYSIEKLWGEAKRIDWKSLVNHTGNGGS